MNDSHNKDTTRLYEVGFLVAPTVPADEAEDKLDTIAEEVEVAGGEVLASAEPEMRELAYTMEVTTSAGDKEFADAQFGWVQFSLEPSEVDNLEDELDAIPDVIRFLLIKIEEKQVGVDSRQENPEDDGDDQETGSEDSSEEADDDGDSTDES